MPELILYHMPGACSRVTLIALEEGGIDYEDRGVALLRGAQSEPGYLAINPKGKVPALVIGGAVITESPVILSYLAKRYPSAGLLPATGNAVADSVGLSDLIWCAGALHPVAHRIFRPDSYSTAPSAGVKAVAIEQMGGFANWISNRIAPNHWWYGAEWSIVDTYMAWCFSVAAEFGFPISSYPAIEAHKHRIEARPSYKKMQKRERAAIERDGLAVPPFYS
jgi:glutathione S-transferase